MYLRVFLKLCALLLRSPMFLLGAISKQKVCIKLWSYSDCFKSISYGYNFSYKILIYIFPTLDCPRSVLIRGCEISHHSFCNFLSWIEITNNVTFPLGQNLWKRMSGRLWCISQLSVYGTVCGYLLLLSKHGAACHSATGG